MRRHVRVVGGVAAASVLALLGGATLPAGAESPIPKAVTERPWNSFTGVALDSSSGTVGESQYKNAPNPICTQTAAYGSVHRTDCEGNAPDNETSIAVNPTDPSNLLAAGNDYQLKLSAGGFVNETAYTRAQVSTDGGATWVSHPIPYKGYYATGDPAVAFDGSGRAYAATLGFVWSQGGPTGTNPDILVSTSTDKGTTWVKPSRVASGTGSWGSPGTFNDKEMITAWGSGNAIVTWTVFNDGVGGSYTSSPIYASVTHDGGKTWTAGVEISGSAAFCTGAGGGTQCNQDQGSWPVVAADGSIYVYFFSTQPSTPDFDDQVLVVGVDPATGQRAAGPYLVSTVQDGLNDYPLSWAGDLTLHDSHFRVPPFGNIAADPTDSQHLAVVWSDMRNSPSVDAGDFANGTFQNPYTTATNSDVMWAESFDGGQTWSAPQPVGASTAGDQFFGSATFLSDGRLVVGMMDRSVDSNNDQYAYTLSEWTGSGWTTTDVSVATSDPTKNNRWFTGGQSFPSFPFPTTFIGDYTTVAASGTTVWALWTDLRNQTTFGTRTGADEQLMATSKSF